MIMKTRLLVLAIFCGLTISSLWAQNKVSYFEGSFDEALAEAGKQDKPLFIKTYTDWCYYCKKLEKESLADKGVASHLNNHFVVYQMNMEEPEGKLLGRKFKVRGYPTILILDSKGSELGRLVGYREATSLQTELKNVIGD